MFVVFNPSALKLITQKMTGEQITDFIAEVSSGRIAYSLISDQEVERVYAHQSWKKRSVSSKDETAEPPKPARALFLALIDEAITAGKNPDYAAIKEVIITAFPDPNPEYCRMIDLDNDDYDPQLDIPYNMWGET